MNALIKVKFIDFILMYRSCQIMKHKLDNSEPLSSAKRVCIEESKSKDEYEEQLPGLLHDPFKSILFQYLSDGELANFSQACKQTDAWTSDEKAKRKISPLLLAVVQGDETKVKRIGNSALVCSTRGVATDYSKRGIQGLTPFQAALCHGDVEMCEMIKKEFFSQLNEGQAEMEKQFNAVFPNGIEAHVKMQQDNVFDFNEILQAIIHAPENEVTAALDKAFDNNLPLHQALEKFRKAFTEKSLSEIVFNPYHLLKAFETYNAEFDNLGNWDKRDLFWRQVIGFVQRYLPACMLQAFAQGICGIVEEKEPLRRSFQFKLHDESILPANAFSGLGFDWAAPGAAAAGWLKAVAMARLRYFFEIMCQTKTSSLEKLLSPIQSSGANANLVCNSLK